MAENNEFGPPAKKDEFGKYFGKYYGLYYGQDVSAGRIAFIDSKNIILNPFKGYRLDPEDNKLKHMLIYEDLEIKDISLNFIRFEPTNKQTLEAICRELNERKYKEEKDKDAK